jgi:hypothetical protein
MSKSKGLEALRAILRALGTPIGGAIGLVLATGVAIGIANALPRLAERWNGVFPLADARAPDPVQRPVTLPDIR